MRHQRRHRHVAGPRARPAGRSRRGAAAARGAPAGPRGPAVDVRVATGLDEDAAVAVWQAAQAARGRRSGGTRAQRVRAKLRASDALLLVAERGGGVVGMLLAELARADDGAGKPVPGVLHLSMLFVAPTAQRSGVGRALLAALLARYPRVQVWTGAEDEAALGLYGAAGFTPTGRTQELPVGPVVQLST